MLRKLSFLFQNEEKELAEYCRRNKQPLQYLQRKDSKKDKN